MITSPRRQLLPFLLVSSVLAASFFVLPAANAEDPAWDTDIATSSPAGLSGIKNTEVHVDVAPGSFSLETCPIPAAGATCVDPTFSFLVPFGNCRATIFYTNGSPPQTGDCWISRSSDPAQAGTATVNVTDPNGCSSFSYEPEPGTSSDIVYTDPAQNRWSVTRIAWSASTHVVVPNQGSQWNTNTVQLVAKTREEGTNRILTLSITLTGSLSATGNCQFTNLSSFTFRIAGTSADIAST